MYIIIPLVAALTVLLNRKKIEEHLHNRKEWQAHLDRWEAQQEEFRANRSNL